MHHRISRQAPHLLLQHLIVSRHVKDGDALRNPHAQLLHQLLRRREGAPLGQQVINEQHRPLPAGALEGVGLDLQDVGPVLLLVLHADRVPGQLASLADGGARKAEPRGEDGAEEEAARLDADEARERAHVVRGLDVVGEMRHHCLGGCGIAKDGEDVRERLAL